jgi:cytochrome c553
MPYLRELANCFATQQLPYPQPEPATVGAALLERGRQLVTQGDAQLRLPACADCHGSALLGVEPAVPGLLGVSQDYLVGQLGAWRSGARAAYAPDCMAQIARRLRPEDLTAVTAWLASQAVPAGAGPQPGFTQTPPLVCGSFTQSAPPPPVPATGSAEERGRELVLLADCEACHTARGGAAFAGGRAIPTPFGTFYSPNITPDQDTAIGRWTAADFWRALHEGISRDGRLLYPTFPYTNYTRITRGDADAMFAYLRTLSPVRRSDTPHALRFPFGHRSLLAAWRLLYFTAGVYRPDAKRDADWNRGAYLVQGLGHCSACHEARNSLGALRSAGATPAGGLVLSWYAPSLADPQQAGVQDWSVCAVALYGEACRTQGMNAPSRSITPMRRR